jgi:hypothetical protein
MPFPCYRKYDYLNLYHDAILRSCVDPAHGNSATNERLGENRVSAAAVSVVCAQQLANVSTMPKLLICRAIWIARSCRVHAASSVGSPFGFVSLLGIF